MPAFWISIGLLSIAQGVIVALGATLRTPWLHERAHSPLWALVPPVSVIGFVFVGRIATNLSATVLTYLALVAVPVLAALALGWLMRGARPLGALLAVVLFVLAWVDRGGLAGQAGALALSSLSCVTLGVLLAALTPPRWLAVGIVVMAAADSVLVIADLLQAPNNALNAAHPIGGLPMLQSAVFGSALMGYGDLFIAGVLGGLLAAHRGRRIQLGGAVTVALLAVSFDLLFFFVDELPATVPVALTLIIIEVIHRRSNRGV